jgi:hypothetical protein
VLRCPYAGNAASRCRGPVSTAGLDVLIHFGRAIRQGRRVDLSLRKWVIGTKNVQRYVYTENSKLMGAIPRGKFKWRVT